MQASARICGRSAADSTTPNCRLKSSQYTLIIPHRLIQQQQKTTISFGSRIQICASQKSTNRYIPSEASGVPTPSSIFIFISSSSTGELFVLNQSEAMFVELGKYSQNMLSEAFRTPNIVSSQFDEYSEVCSRSKCSPN